MVVRRESVVSSRQSGVAADLLATIVAATRRIVEVREEREPLAALSKRAEAVSARGGRFLAALSRADRVNVIAECKRRSPSRGVLRANYDPVAIARRYAEAGAAAISVLTEPTFFDGSLEHLQAVRAAIDAGAGIIGVNNRNLRTLEVDVEASARLIARIPGGVVAVSESGLRTVEDLVRLRSLGYRAFLVGERFMSQRDPGMALRELLRGASAASSGVGADLGRPDRSC